MDPAEQQSGHAPKKHPPALQVPELYVQLAQAMLGCGGASSVHLHLRLALRLSIIVQASQIYNQTPVHVKQLRMAAGQPQCRTLWKTLKCLRLQQAASSATPPLAPPARSGSGKSCFPGLADAYMLTSKLVPILSYPIHRWKAA